METSETIEIDGFQFRRRSKHDRKLGPSSQHDTLAPSHDANKHEIKQGPPSEVKSKSDNPTQNAQTATAAVETLEQNQQQPEQQTRPNPSASRAKRDQKQRKSQKRKVALKPQKMSAVVQDILRAEYAKASLSGANAQELEEIEQGIVDVVSAASSLEESSTLSQLQYEKLIRRESYLMAMAQELATDLRAWERIRAEERQPKSAVSLPSSPCLSGKSAHREIEAVPVISPRGAERLTLSGYDINDSLKALEAQNADNSMIIAAVTKELLS
jgi:hypothetical protein